MKLSQARSEKLHSLSRPTGPRLAASRSGLKPEALRPDRAGSCGRTPTPQESRQPEPEIVVRTCHGDDTGGPTLLPLPGIAEPRTETHLLNSTHALHSVRDLSLQQEAPKLGFLGVHFRILSRQLGGLISIASSPGAAGELGP